MAKPVDIFPADLSIDQIRAIAHRAANEKVEALAKAHEIIARSRECIERVDEILSRRS